MGRRPAGNSNYYSWLYSQICAQYEDGEALLASSKAHGGSKTTWLLEELCQRGNEQLAEEFRLRRNAAANEQNWQRKRERLARLEQSIRDLQIVGKQDIQLGRMKAKARRMKTAIEAHE